MRGGVWDMNSISLGTLTGFVCTVKEWGTETRNGREAVTEGEGRDGRKTL